MKSKIANPVLLTGASGFIGSNLVRRLLKEKREVYLILRKDSKLWRIKDILPQTKVCLVDLTCQKVVFQLIKKIKPKTIFHLASYGAYSFQTGVERIMAVNFYGTMNLVNACAKLGFEIFINTGSSSEYGFKNKPMKEADLLEPNSYYAVSKAAGTLYCQYLAKAKKLPIITLRLFSVYGAYEKPTRLVPTLITSFFKNSCPPLVFPESARDYTYIDDVNDAYLLAAQKPKLGGEIFNIGNGKQITLKEIVNTVIKLAGANVEIKWRTMPPRIWDHNTWQACIFKAKKLLGWQPKNDLNQGLRKTISWFKENINLYRK